MINGVNTLKELSLIPVSRKHIDQILIIERDSFTNPWNRKNFEDELSVDNSFLFGVERKTESRDFDKKLISYINYRLILDEMHIMKIGVIKDMKCQGVATWLLDKIFNLVKKNSIKTSFLETRISNSPAIFFYKKMGYRVIGKRLNYYSDNNEDALIMKKDFTG